MISRQRRLSTAVMGAAGLVFLAGCGGATSAIPSPTPSASDPTSDFGTPERGRVGKVDRTLTDPRITESSGLATSPQHPGVLWTHNDSSGGPYVYAVDQTGKTVARLTLKGAPDRDWEGIASTDFDSRPTLWVGDIGDNVTDWPTVRVLKVAEPAQLKDATVSWTQYDFEYPDGPRNAEALMVSPVDGRIYIVTKKAVGAAVYRAPKTLSTDEPNKLTKLWSAPAIVTDGAFSPDGKRYALRGYVGAWIFDAATGKKLQSVDLPLQVQGESLTWTADGKALLVGSEGDESDIWRVPVPAR